MNIETLRQELAAAVAAKPVMSNWQAALDYLQSVYAGETVETFRVMYLDRKNRLIACEVLGRGTVDHVPVYPREVVKRALLLDASAMILAHNHPSGDPEPSRSDLDMTRDIQQGAAFLGLTVHDHIVIGAGIEHSMRAAGEMQ